MIGESGDSIALSGSTDARVDKLVMLVDVGRRSDLKRKVLVRPVYHVHT